MNSFELPIALQENKQLTDIHLINDIGLKGDAEIMEEFSEYYES